MDYFNRITSFEKSKRLELGAKKESFRIPAAHPNVYGPVNRRLNLISFPGANKICLSNWASVVARFILAPKERSEYSVAYGLCSVVAFSANTT